VHFGMTHRTIRKLDLCGSLQLSPSLPAIELS